MANAWQRRLVINAHAAAIRRSLRYSTSMQRWTTPALTDAATAAWAVLDWPRTSTDQQARHSCRVGARATKEQLPRHATAPLHVLFGRRRPYLDPR